MHPDGTATGRVIGNAAFMRLRTQRTPFGHAARLGELVDTSTAVVESTTTVPPDEVALGEGAFSVGLHLPDVQCGVYHDDGSTEVLLYHVATDSVASVHITPHAVSAGCYRVRQYGPRELWDEAERAHHWWVDHGRPGRIRYGLTVSPDQQQVWLDEPAR